MKNFKDYLSESAEKYDFRIKIAGTVTTEQVDALKNLLQKFQVSGFKKVSTTPIQEMPLDFPKIKNAEVSIFEVSLDYPSTQWELKEYLGTGLGLTQDAIVVRRPGEPSEEYQEPQEKREGALLNDSEYKEAPNAKFEDFYGDKYNTDFVKELNAILKLQRKERGEQIPEAKSDDVMKNPGATTNDLPQNNTSVFNKVAEDPRKK